MRADSLYAQEPAGFQASTPEKPLGLSRQVLSWQLEPSADRPLHPPQPVTAVDPPGISPPGVCPGEGGGMRAGSLYAQGPQVSLRQAFKPAPLKSSRVLS